MLKNKDFNLLLLGRFITNFGDSLYLIATMSLVFSMTGSTFYTGVALFLTSSMAIFQVLLSPLFARINIKKFLCLSQLLQGLLLLIIPILEYFNKLTVYHILIIMPIISLINQLVYPAELSLLPRLLDQKDLIKANSLFSIAYQGSDAIFNALSGFLISILGFTFAYYIDSITFFINAILFIFLSKAVATKVVVTKSEKGLRKSLNTHFFQLKSGLKLWRNKILKALLIGVIIINYSATMIYASLPEFSIDQSFYGILLSASGVGVLLGSIVANIDFIKRRNLGVLYIAFIIIASLSWIVMTLCDINSLSGRIISFSFFLIGWTLVGILNIYSQTLVQMIVPTEKIGVALSSMIGISVALAPLGALSTSFLSKYFSAERILLLASLFILLTGIYWLFNQNIRNMPSLSNWNNINTKTELRTANENDMAF